METDTVRRPHRCAGKNKQKGSSDPEFIFWGTDMSFKRTQAGGSQGWGPSLLRGPVLPDDRLALVLVEARGSVCTFQKTYVTVTGWVLGQTQR